MSVSIGNDLKDGFKQTNNWITNNIEFLGDIEQFYRQRALIEKEYATSLQKLTAEFLKRKANKSTSISVGDKPAITPGSLESASITTWNQILSNTEIISQNHLNFSKELSIKVGDQILSLQRSSESIREKIESFHNNQLQKQKQDNFDQVTKAKKQYDETCQTVENARSKAQKNPSTSKYEKKFKEHEIEMNISKNNYLIRINIANRIKDKFYYQDLPEVLDLYQDLNEFKTKQLNLLLASQNQYEINLNNKNIKNLKDSIDIINENLPNLDTQMFIKHNAISDWNEPQDFYYIPSSIWHDDDTFITKEGEMNELKKRLLKSKQVISKLQDTLEQEKETLNKVRDSKETLKNSPINEFEYKKSLEFINNYFSTLTRFISNENSKVEAQVAIETIQNNVNEDISLEGLSLQTKKTGFFSKLRGSSKKEKLVDNSDTFDDSNSLQASSIHDDSHSIQSSAHTSHNFKFSSLLRSKSLTSSHPDQTTTVSVLQGTASYDYQAQGDDEVSIHSNEKFKVIQPDDGSGWTKIQHNGAEGLVPTSYITIETVHVTKKKGPEVKPRKANVKRLKYCNVKFDYEAEEEGELTIREGERLVVLEGDDEGWTTGENSSGEKGTFPTSYVEFE